jgi:hypothetical protein
MLTYNLFRHKEEVDLYCAVPECMPVPAFLNNDEWVYSCPIDNRLFARFEPSTQPSTLGNEFILLQPSRKNRSRSPEKAEIHT